MPPIQAVTALDHVAVLVRDLDGAITGWQALFGLPEVAREEMPERGLRMAWLDGGGARLQLVEPTAAGPLQTFLEERGEGLHHLCFEVADVRATVAALAPGALDQIAGGPDGRQTCFLPSGPNGVTIELVQHAAGPERPAATPKGTG